MDVLGWLSGLFRRTPPPEAPRAGGAGASGSWIDLALLRAAAPATNVYTLERHLEPVARACAEFRIDTPARIAAFVAQVAHESGGFQHVRELASGAAYEGRRDLGNTQPGDGPRFRGRGLIQITGRTNYRDASRALFGDERLLLAPQLLERPDLSARAAGWYWRSRGLNELADAGQFVEITRRINGGTNGLEDRLARWRAVKSHMGVVV